MGGIHFPPFCFIRERRGLHCSYAIEWWSLSPLIAREALKQESRNCGCPYTHTHTHTHKLNDLEIPPAPSQRWNKKGLVYIYGSTTWLGQHNLA